MTWQELLAAGRVARESTARSEILELKLLTERYLGDARLTALSDDGRFDRAYGAARTLSVMVIRSEGYRVKSAAGSHQATFLALDAADTAAFSAFASFFNRCRAKRNELSYEHAGIISLAEVEDLLGRVEEFGRVVTAWISSRHPDLV